MSAAPPWVAPYVGIPYMDKGRARTGADCWGLVRMVQRDVFHVDLPDYGDAYRDGEDWERIGQAVAAGLAAGWRQVARPATGDLVILRIAERPWHCGVAVSGSRFLHALSGYASVVERFDCPRWSNRIEGFYRHG
ncbi:MAG TPA: NlpC/P60 family protein [Frateuria sp.]|uniref:NlpC/P60 family protein n=1 Tax=Frateuria sp. TaxID=2211372 RepID=UPI002D7F7EEE|nr:NlpC/P60 family protein [Frateuria sp.]HET6805330.1 NlpC/P60 family protein [Frateuria sp.]